MTSLNCDRPIGVEDHASRGLGPVMRRRAQDVIDNPKDWRLGGALIWKRQDGQRVTDQAVEFVRSDRRRD